ncbi:MAG: hypothetical protein AB1801_09135 [Chloroflexota bacterium]
MNSHRPRLQKSPRALLPFWIGWFLFAVYLLSFSGKFHVMDEVAVFTAGHNLARYGRADINPLLWTHHWTPNPPGIWGVDHNLYTKKAPGISFIAAPLIWLGHALPGLNAVHVGLLTNALVTALTAGLLLVWLVDLGFTRLSAGLASLGYGLCSMAWVYARMFWESSLLALFFLVAIWAAYRAIHSSAATSRRRWLLGCGLAAAVGLTLRFEAAAAAGLIGLYLAWDMLAKRPRRMANGGPNRERNAHTLLTDHSPPFAAPRFPLPPPRSSLSALRPLPSLLLYLAPTLLVALGLAWFNLARFGSLIETGYTQELLFRAPWVGGWGLLFSPGRGLFIYAPLLLLLFFGLRPAWRRLPRPYFWLIAGVSLFYWLFYGSWFAWGGTWGWGPRFLLPILPLLMLFVAGPIEWASQARPERPQPWLWPARLGMAGLVLLSLAVNLLGVTVDFNEHFLRLGRNDNFVFNWAAFPPLGHWRILREGLVDLIWLRPGPAGLTIDWPSLTPALLLLILAAAAPATARRAPKLPFPRSPLIVVSLCLLLTAGLTYQMMRATARIAWSGQQAQADGAVLDRLAASARPGDALHVSLPPFGDVLETSTLLLAYLEPSLPAYTWIESQPRAIQPEERERVWQATQAGARRVWLFERWLTPADPLSLSAARLAQEAFPVQEQWFERSGRLTLYALADASSSAQTMPLNIPFQGEVTLVEAAIWDHTVAPGEILKVRLTWQIPPVEQLAASGLPNERLIAFVHLIAGPAGGQNVAQQDRLLLDLQHIEQSPLRPGQTTSQGYGLQLPAGLSPGVYPLIGGLYTAGAAQRLSRIDGSPDDFLYLGDVTVQ